MSKFFTRPLGPLLACLWPALASGEMTVKAPVMPGPDGKVAGSSEEPGLPRPLASGRFGSLAKKSPFTLASTSEENADFAKDLILAGYFRMDGQDYVMVANRTQPARLMVGTQASPSAQGVVLIKVERDPSGDPTKLRAQIRKGTETATLKYEAASAAPTGQPAPAPAASAPPGVPGQPPAVQNVPGAPAAGKAPNPPVIRRRVIPIPSAPVR